MVFHVDGTQESIHTKPSMLDYSMSIAGVNCNLKSRMAARNLKGVQTVIDSYFPDTILGNDAGNFISTHGHDYIQGNGGKDFYKVTANCKDTYINNYDPDKDSDVIFIERKFTDVYLSLEKKNNSLELNVNGFGTVLTLLHWFQDQKYRHAAIRSEDGITGTFPATIPQLKSFEYKLNAIEISLDQEDCQYGLKTYNLNEKSFLSVSRFTAKSDRCRYKVIGNGKNNYIDPGPGNLYGYQYLEGGNGSDTYVIGPNYGEFNRINNHATDDKVDFLLLNIAYQYIEVGTTDDAHLLLNSFNKGYRVAVAMMNFLHGKQYQHILVQSADKVLFRLLPHYPYKKAIIVNYAQAPYAQILNLSKLFPEAGILYSPRNKSNTIYGSHSSTKLSGGVKKDKIEGGPLGETIEGLSGDDTIFGHAGDDVIYGGNGDDVIQGNNGNDVIYGGKGGDHIQGGLGMDTVIFQGDSVNAKGVTVSLKDGHGRGADAEMDTYVSIEAVSGTEFNDVIEGSNSNNIIGGSGGNDTMIAHNGYDIFFGGLDNDIYDFTKASGTKVISNFASDGKLDVLMLEKMKKAPCYYSYKSDLFAHFETSHNENIDVILQNWFKGSKFQHLSLNYTDHNDKNVLFTLKSSYAVNDKLSSDEWVRHVKDNAKLEIISHGSDFVEVNVLYTLKSMEMVGHQIALQYLTEGQNLRWIDISSMLRSKKRSLKLDNLTSGTMTSVSLTLHRCSQVLFMTTPVLKRTTPNPPTNAIVSHVSEESISVTWKIPSNVTDPNCEFYSFKCIAVAMSTKKHTATTITEKNKTSCLLNKLKHDTLYRISVISLAASEESRSLSVQQKTVKYCKDLKVPDNGAVVDARRSKNGANATLICMDGYELAIVEKDDKEALRVSEGNQYLMSNEHT